MPHYIFWTAVLVILCLIEANTANLITIWFAAGALVTLIVSSFGVSVLSQVSVFIISSVLFLLLTRPLVKKKLSVNTQKTNSDMVIGKTAIVRESITPEKFSGLVTVGGKMWSAVSADGSVIDEGEEVTVEAIEGVKLVVAKKIKAEII